MFVCVTETFAVTNLFIFVAISNLLSINILTDRDSSYAIGFNMTNLRSSSDEIFETSTHSDIQFYIKDTTIDGEEILTLKEFLSVKAEEFESFSLNNSYATESLNILSVNSNGVFSINYDTIEESKYTSIDSIKNDVFSSSNPKFGRTNSYSYKFIDISLKNPDIAMLESDGFSTSSRSLNNVKLDQFRFEPFGGLLVLGCLFLSKQYLRK
jgi:hypothetical protein